MVGTSIKNLNDMQQFVEQIYRNNKNYQGVVFLDRDGTINKEVNYLRSKYQMQILPSVVRGLRILNKKHIAIVVITNQPVVARGLITIEGLKKLNDLLFETLSKEDAYIDAIYSCPHHPERDHPDIPKRAVKYRIKCECRKPGLAMYKKALLTYGSKKIMGVIGDQTRDVLAGKKLLIPTVIVRTGYCGEDEIYDVVPDFICDNFLAAVRRLL
jgi:histidinol-phosphate phosphatase family protein